MAGGEPEDSYHACKNRHGPKCQQAQATPWLEQQRARLLPVPSLLVTVTLPQELRPRARAQQHRMDNLRFQTSAAALQALAMDPHDLGGRIGMGGVLHTWTREMA
jgi:hypothetical protein